jgi:hypothetical protein
LTADCQPTAPVAAMPSPTISGQNPKTRPVVARLHNNGVTAHTFTIYDIGMDVVLQLGQRRTVTVQPPSGAVSWRFLCRFHDAGGMHGSLTLGNPPPSPLGPP